jgi:hypothetical protein
MGRYIDQRCLTLALCFVSALASAQQPTAPAIPPAAPAAQPLPPIRELLLDVERNEKASEAARKDYTYHVHIELDDLDSKGNIKKTSITDAEDLTIDDVPIHRIVARNGRPLTAEETQKENARIDKEVAQAKARREKREDKGQETNSNGDVIISASRILELGAFSNPRRVDLDSRPTIVLDYAGDPNAKTHNKFEGIVRDLVGTVWIDEQDRVLVRGEGHFLNDFKIGGGLVLNIHKGLSFDFRATRINSEVWLPAIVDGQGSARILLVDQVKGRFRLVTSDYRKFRATSTIIPTNGVIGPNDQPASSQPASTAQPPPTQPLSPRP